MLTVDSEALLSSRSRERNGRALEFQVPFVPLRHKGGGCGSNNSKGSSMSANDPVSRGYNYRVVRQFSVMTIVWGVVGMLVGVLIAAQLAWPALNFDIPWLSFGRLRPLHTNAVIFAFGGCALFATSLFVVQRTCQAPLCSDKLAAFVFWGWQLVIVCAAVSLPLGYSTSKEYAELEWPIDVLIAVVWIAYAWLFFGTIARRKTAHIYVANWFYGGFILTVAVLHVVNSLAIPVSPMKSYSIYAGTVDAMVQWWYGHNAVGFFLTAGFLGMMYYFVPKQAGRPIYSYRLSVVHFWALISVYMWAGPHHLHYTALPDWAQSLGMVFSLILLAPSWGGMINGMMTLSGAWQKLRNDPVIRFMIVSLSFYGMATFEGPMMAIKTVNALSHYTDWTIGHVHSGALGWVAMMTIGSLYCLIPMLYGVKSMYSMRLVNLHFWLATFGVILYACFMWIAGVMQGLMWRAVNEDGTLTYSFVQSVEATWPYYVGRLVGGLMFFIGMLIMAYNTYKTIRGARPVENAALES
jgi:cytochrome c oxidase cbb3-type subunit 1